ncbi:MAG: nucleotidyltransferase [Bacilli bacterium]|nr:nucleotidyltransferase [Bacilli bacterium]
MQVIGVIVEYNPFHNGHVYHINKIKEKYPDSIIIAVISNYFLERGEISILSKDAKTNIALKHGIDIVIELPTICAVESADIFANNAIKLLNYLKVNKIIFGSESNNIEQLEQIVNIELNDKEYDKRIKEYLDLGYNYPTSMNKALNIEGINSPNDLLGISYIKAIKENNYDIEYESIKRTNDYHDTASNSTIISASNIRNKIRNNEDINSYLPEDSYKSIIKINDNKLFELLKYKIISSTNLDIIKGVDEGIHNKLKKEIINAKNINELTERIKSKRYTYNRINRMYINILLDIQKNVKYEIDYIKVLGFNDKGRKYLNSIKKEIDKSLIPNNNSYIYQCELKASLIYDLITKQNTYIFEIKNKPIIN